MAVAVLADPIFDPSDERLSKRPLHQVFIICLIISAGQRCNSLCQRSRFDERGNPYLSRLLYTRNEADAVMAVTPPG